MAAIALRSPQYKSDVADTGSPNSAKITISKIGRAHVWTPVTDVSRMPSSAWKKKYKSNI